MSTYRDLRPDDTRPVQVQLDDGRWCDGWLEAYANDGTAWSGYVRYSTAVERSGRTMTENYLGWFEEGRIRGVTTGA